MCRRAYARPSIASASVLAYTRPWKGKFSSAKANFVDSLIRAGRQAGRQAAVRPVIGGGKSNFNFNSPRNLFDSFKHRGGWTGRPTAIIPFLSIAFCRKEKVAGISNLLIQRLESWHHCFNR